MIKKVDYLIVGQGLAGSVFAYTALLKNKKITVITSNQLPASSKVAAGIINSVVIKRLTKSWRADKFNSYLIDFYPKMEKYLKNNFFHKTNTLKIIGSDEEESFWKSRREAGQMEDYISGNISTRSLPNSFKFYKTGDIYQTYLLEFNKLLKDLKKRLIEDQRFLEEEFDYSKINLNGTTVKYKNIEAKCIIFCEGIHAIRNPFFNWLPFNLNKGESVTIKSTNLKTSSVINKKIFILPLGNNTYKVGSSYEWKKLNNQPTEEKRNEILRNFENLCSAEYKIVGQEAGIRPATRDRRPFIGIHPEHKNLFIFNGMGAKAALMAPLLAKELFEFIEEKKKLNEEGSIERYNKLYQIDPLK